MAYLDYRRHFILLAAAVVVLASVSRFSIYDDALFDSASQGALYAATLVAALRGSATAVRKLVFVAIAAALSVMSLYVGKIAWVRLSVLPAGERLPAVIALDSIIGAITYASLVRIFWIRVISLRMILGMAMICAVAPLLGYVAKLKFHWSGIWWFAALWWLAFSVGLRLMGKRPLISSASVARS